MGSIEVFYKPSPDLTIKVECKDMEDMFQTMSPIQEVLGGNTSCGRCGKKNIRMIHRQADGNDIHELECQSRNDRGIPCGARLAIGKSQKTKQLFPRRYELEKDEEGKWQKKVDAQGNTVWLPHNGWVKWDAKEKKYVQDRPKGQFLGF